MASSSSAPLPLPPWLDLPQEIITVIFQKVGAIELLRNVQRVCKTWNKICKDPATWRVIDLRNNNNICDRYLEKKICQHVVDLSQGQLIDISFKAFFTEDILSYIAQRSGQLRRLEIVCSYDLGDRYFWGYTLSDACKKFPLLEELHIFYYQRLSTTCIKNIGDSCPFLTSLKLNNINCHGYLGSREMGNDEALAIASTMPRLRNLQLIGHCTSDEGVTSILNGCVEIESLDLRLCCYVTLKDELCTRCSQQLKHWRSPCDDSTDYEYNDFIIPTSDLTEYDDDYYGNTDLMDSEEIDKYNSFRYHFKGYV